MPNTVAITRAAAELPPGQKGPRAEVLREIKGAGGLTARELSGRLGLSLNAVRHHLKELESAGLLSYDRTYRGVGAPVFRYRLTPHGESLFPSRLEGPLNQLLDHVVAREGRASAIALLERYFRDLGARLEQKLQGATPETRREVVFEALAAEGFMPEWRSTSNQNDKLVMHNCPIRLVAERFPEVCGAETRFLKEALGTALEREGHLLAGCASCEYRLQPEEKAG